MRLPIRALAVVMAGSVGGGWLAAEPLRSPSETLRLPENQLALLVAVEAAEEGDRHLFRRADDAETVLAVRVPAERPELAAGSRWWVGFTELKRQPPDPRTFVRDPGGPRVLELEGVGSALFPGIPAVGLALGAPADGSASVAGAERLGAVIDLLAAEEPVLRRLAATELGLGKDLWSLLEAGGLQAMDAAFNRAGDERYVRFRLLEAARGAAAGGVDGAAARSVAWARTALTAGVELGTASYDPALRILALEALAAHGGREDADVIAPALRVGHPAVGRQAVWTFRSLAPDKLLEVGPEVLSSGALDPETRRVLQAVLEQLQGDVRSARPVGKT